MKFTKTIAAVSLAGIIALGGASMASAQSAPPADSGPSFTVTVSCAKAEARLDEMETKVANAEGRVAQATTKRDELAAAGRTKAADFLTTRIDRANERLPQVEARIEKLGSLLAEKCPAA